MPFSTLPGEAFIGRQRALFELTRLAEEERAGGRGILIEGQRGIGKSELLRQLYTLLFWKQEKVVPFFYRVSPASTLVKDLAKDYLARFLCQWFGFEHKEQDLVLADDIGLDELHSLALVRNAEWAARLLDRFRSVSASPLDLLRSALHAPRAAARAAGRNVVVLIDDFHLLAGLHRDSLPEPHLAALFDDIIGFPRTPHLVTGLAPAIDEFRLPVLERYPVEPLVLSDADLLVRTLLRERQIVSSPVPQELLLRLGGNPLYLTCVARTVLPDSGPPDRAYWDAYRREVAQGTIARTWRAVLRAAFPDTTSRRPALETLHAVTCRERSPGSAWTERSLRALVQGLTPEVLNALGRHGLVRGEFGTFLPSEDAVFRDVVGAIYRQDVLGTAPEDPASAARDRQQTAGNAPVTVDLLLPHAPEAELVAAQCLEQLGRNRNVPSEVIGQLQIALIEACVNALEHGQSNKPVPVSISVDKDSVEVSVTSSGQDFVLDGTGEPASIPHPGAELRRGWGVTLMKRFCDTVRFERTAQGTTVVLRKHWSPAGRPDTKENKTHEQLRPFPEE